MRQLWYTAAGLILLSHGALARLGGGTARGKCADGSDVEVLFGYGARMVPTKSKKQLSDELEQACQENGSTLDVMTIL